MLGTTIGFLLALFVFHKLSFALAGALVGYLVYDQTLGAARKRAQAELPKVQYLFFKTVFSLLGHVAKADGHISELEIKLTEAYMDKMGLTPEHKREAIQLFKEGATSEFNLQAVLTEFQPIGKRSPNLSQMLLVYIINLAMIDGILDESEMRILRSVANSLGFSNVVLDELLRMIGAQNSFAQGHKISPNELDLAYQALGVNGQTSDVDIKKAYRKLMSQYHPDKLIGQGLPADMIKAATERSQEIQAAYGCVKKSRG